MGPSRSKDKKQIAFGNQVFRLLVETVEDYAMCALDTEGRVVHWNAGAVCSFGYSEEEMIGHPLEIVFTEEDRTAGIAQHELEIADAQGRAEDERWHVRKDGSRFWAVGIVAPVRDDKGALLGFGKIMRDRTDIKEVQEALRNRASELARSDADKNVFLATLAHELRTPLAVLMNSAELLRKKAAVDNDRIADMIERQVRHTKRLVDDLTDIARVGRNKLQLRRVPLDLCEVVDRAVEMVQSLVQARSQDLQVRHPACALMISGDPGRVLQIFVNLLNNAAKFTHDGGQISATTTSEGNEAVARIVDNGEGMTPEQMESIFELFSQAHTAAPGSNLGLGIGLALTRDLVTLHQGTIQARSPGLRQGSEFIVRLPLISGEQHISADSNDGAV